MSLLCVVQKLEQVQEFLAQHLTSEQMSRHHPLNSFHRNAFQFGLESTPRLLRRQVDERFWYSGQGSCRPG